MPFNPEELTRLTFLETDEGDGTEAKRSKSFSKVLLVLLFAMEQDIGASGKRDQNRMQQHSLNPHTFLLF